jgi:DNA-binding transcriptional regulator YiaG
MEKIELKHNFILSRFGRDNDWQVIKLSHEGISKEFIIQLGNYINFSTEELANILNISERTLKRYSEN